MWGKIMRSRRLILPKIAIVFCTLYMVIGEGEVVREGYSKNTDGSFYKGP